MSSIQIQWTKVQPHPDPLHGTPVARSSHGVSIVRDGNRLILVGGEHVARTPIGMDSAMWVVDDLRSTPRWRWLGHHHGSTAPNKAVPPDRIAHAQAVYQDRYVYIFGGRAGTAMNECAMDDLWVLDCSGEPGEETWNPVTHQAGTPPEARSFHRMVCIGSSLYVFGGCGSTSGRLNDLHRFDIPTQTWTALGCSTLRGRGGPNLFPLSDGSRIAVMAGFCGEETSDGQIFDLVHGKWDENLLLNESLRPRSVCVAASFPKLNVAIIFGGEVDPSDRGHEGAGGFENDVIILDEGTGLVRERIQPGIGTTPWPEPRGWSDGATFNAELYVFGGLTGDDANPRRLGDLWKMDILRT